MMSVPDPTLVSEAVLLAPNPVARVTVLLWTSSVAAAAEARASRPEMSWVLPAAHCKVEVPPSVTVPLEPRPPLANDTIPASSVVPPL